MSLPVVIAVTGAVCGVLSTSVVVVGLFFSARQHDRERRRDEAAAKAHMKADIAAAKAEGCREKEREMRPELNLLRSERDDARHERDLCQQETAALKARCDRLEEELFRRRSHGQGS